MAAGDAEAGGLPRSGAGAIMSTFNYLRSARQSLVCYTACVGVACAVRGSVCFVTAPWWLARSVPPVSVGRQRLWQARRFQCQSASGGFGRSGVSAALFVNLGRRFAASSSACGLVCSAAVLVRAGRYNPRLLGDAKAERFCVGSESVSTLPAHTLAWLCAPEPCLLCGF